jgi:2-isopropylmalate synthase
MAELVKIFDTTLRDGEQSPGASMNPEEKIRVAKQLERLQVDVIEAGFPASSEGDFESVRRIAREIKGVEIAGLARTDLSDIDRCWEAVREAEAPRIHTFIATSDIHLQHKLKKTREEVLRDVARAVAHARRYLENVEFSAEDATRSDPDYLVQVCRVALENGASTLNIPDTVGYTTPEEYARLIRLIREEVVKKHPVILSVHCHDDLGMAVANTLAALREGARQVECTINGIGERAGNTAMEEVVMALRTRKVFYGLETRIVTEQIYPASRMLSKITGIVVQPNKAIVGANAFAHEAGIHVDGVLKNALTYEIMKPETIGLASNLIVLGKHSGRAAFRDRVKALGYELDDAALGKSFKRFKAVADKKKEVFDEDIEAIVADEIFRAPDRYHLISMNIATGSEMIPTATVQIEFEGKILRGASTGDGPVDAIYQTIAEITGTRAKLLRFDINAITGGADAQGEVTVRLSDEGQIAIGQGAHTDILVASARAYINALNKLEHLKRRGTEVRSPGP